MNEGIFFTQRRKADKDKNFKDKIFKKHSDVYLKSHALAADLLLEGGISYFSAGTNTMYKQNVLHNGLLLF